jgi:hypothetical protein
MSRRTPLVLDGVEVVVPKTHIIERIEAIAAENDAKQFEGGFDGLVTSLADYIAGLVESTRTPQVGIQQPMSPVRIADVDYSAAYIARAVRWRLLHDHFCGVEGVDVVVMPHAHPDPVEKGKVKHNYSVDVHLGKFSMGKKKNRVQFEKYWKSKVLEFFRIHPNSVPDSQCCFLCPSIGPTKAMPLAICECAQQRAMIKWIAYGPPKTQPKKKPIPASTPTPAPAPTQSAEEELLELEASLPTPPTKPKPKSKAKSAAAPKSQAKA